MPFSVKKDPHFYTAYNPLQNIEIHPDFNSSIHPRFQSTLNPQFRSQINPMLNAQIHPQFNAELNPQFQSRLNPDFNPSLRILTPDFVYYSLELEPLLFLWLAKIRAFLLALIPSWNLHSSSSLTAKQDLIYSMPHPNFQTFILFRTDRADLMFSPCKMNG